MRTLNMRFVCGWIPIGFKQSDLLRMLFERNGVQRQDARFNTNRSLDLFFKSEFVGVKLRWVNLQFCYPHNRASDHYGRGSTLPKQQGRSQRCPEQQRLSPRHMQPPSLSVAPRTDSTMRYALNTTDPLWGGMVGEASLLPSEPLDERYA